MVEFLQNINQYHWLSFACVMVMLEIFGFAGFMLGFALAGFTLFITLSYTDLIWQYQIIIFAVISLVVTVVWYKYQNNEDMADDETSTLNKKESQLVGTKITLDEDIEPGKARVKIGDTTWAAIAEDAFKAGDIVEVSKVNGIFLHIAKK